MAEYIGKMHELISDAFAAAENRCLYFDREGNRCRAKAIQSHSLQKRGPLLSISERGHLIKVGPSLKASRYEDRSFFERVGVNKASTFEGFCAHHDREVFSEVEVADVPVNARSALIFALRTAALEHCRKKVMVELQKGVLRYLTEKGDNRGIQEASWILRGAEIAIAEGTPRIKALFSYYHRDVPSNFLYAGLAFQNEGPFAATGAFEPEIDLFGRGLFLVDPMRTKWNYLSIFCGNIRGRLYVFIAGVQKYRHHRIDEFHHSIDLRSSDLHSL